MAKPALIMLQTYVATTIATLWTLVAWYTWYLPLVQGGNEKIEKHSPAQTPNWKSWNAAAVAFLREATMKDEKQIAVEVHA